MESGEMNQIDRSQQVCSEDSKNNPLQRNKMATTGFILALLGLVFCWVPVLNILLWIGGLVFSIIGMTRAYKVFAAIGIGITGVSVTVLCFMTVYKIVTTLMEDVSFDAPTEVLVEGVDSPDKPDYIEIKGKKGYVPVYYGIPKDSVKLLLGRPDEVEYYKMGNVANETWSYKIRKSYIADLRIEFRNGRMCRVDQD